MFGLPFPTYLVWIFDPLTTLTMLVITVRAYMKYKKEEEENDKK